MFASPGVAPVVALPIERIGNAPRTVRRAIAAAFPAGGPLVEDMTLVASELVTNVIRHTSGAGTVCIWDSNPPLLTVSDSSLAPVVVEGAGEGGRGLAIVSDIAAEWGTTHTTHGKTIWVQFPDRSSPDARSSAVPFEQPQAVSDAFDSFMADVAPALVIATVAGTDLAGCLVNMHSPCGRSPAQYSLWLRRSNHTFSVARLAPTIALHFLDEADSDLAELFASSAADIDKFACCEWTPGPSGVPLIDRLPRRLILQDITVWESTGDHCCVVGTVAAVAPTSATAR